MPNFMREGLAGSVLFGLAVLAAMAAGEARAGSSPSSEEIVLGSHNSPAALGPLGGELAQAPVPQGNEDVEPSFGGPGFRPYPPPPAVAPPQIITLPASKAGMRGAVRGAPSAPALTPRRAVARLHRRVPRFISMARRPFAWPIAYTCGRYVVGLIPIGFSPCNDQPHSALYNTPCGVRDYE
jgi:hypothetical protein